jgi:hypothetical protein
MRYMVMHKHDEHTEAGKRPPPELIQKMGEFIGEYASRGQFLDGNGLGASATRTRLTFRGGACTVKHGPYGGGHELVNASAVLKVSTREQAIGWAERWGKILGDGEIELGPVNEPWDLGLMPKPADAPLRVLLLEKTDAATESGAGRSPQVKAALSRLKTEMEKAGVLQSSATLRRSSESKRLQFTRNTLRLIDGPFGESKELIGGYALLDLPSIETVIDCCKRYAEILGGTLEMDIRPVADED